jgi:hypothetical protein
MVFRLLFILVVGLLGYAGVRVKMGEGVLPFAVGACAAVIAGLLSFSKNILDAIRTYQDIRLKQQEIRSQESRIVRPSPEDIKAYGRPYVEKKRDLLASYEKEPPQILRQKDFIVESEETRSTDSDG